MRRSVWERVGRAYTLFYTSPTSLLTPLTLTQTSPPHPTHSPHTSLTLSHFPTPFLSSPTLTWHFPQHTFPNTFPHSLPPLATSFQRKISYNTSPYSPTLALSLRPTLPKFHTFLTYCEITLIIKCSRNSL